MFRKNARIPLNHKAHIPFHVASIFHKIIASHSPAKYAQIIHCMNASGDIRNNRSMGCNFSDPTCTLFVTIVLTAASNAPRLVMKNPMELAVYSPNVASATPSIIYILSVAISTFGRRKYRYQRDIDPAWKRFPKIHYR